MFVQSLFLGHLSKINHKFGSTPPKILGNEISKSPTESPNRNIIFFFPVDVQRLLSVYFISLFLAFLKALHSLFSKCLAVPIVLSLFLQSLLRLEIFNKCNSIILMQSFWFQVYNIDGIKPNHKIPINTPIKTFS